MNKNQRKVLKLAIAAVRTRKNYIAAYINFNKAASLLKNSEYTAVRKAFLKIITTNQQ